MTDKQPNKWDESYRRHENALFYPSEEIVRFVNRHIRRRIGPNDYSRPFNARPRFLDVGSGAGRHVFFLWENGFFPIGVELSSAACEQAKEFLSFKGVDVSEYEVINASATSLPIEDESIDYAISAATLDSMSTSDAFETVSEVFRVLKYSALFYVDLISNEFLRNGTFLNSSDQVVDEPHERGTIQSYYNAAKIEELFSAFNIRSIMKVVHQESDGTPQSARWHVVVEKLYRDG